MKGTKTVHIYFSLVCRSARQLSSLHGQLTECHAWPCQHEYPKAGKYDLVRSCVVQQIQTENKVDYFLLDIYVCSFFYVQFDSRLFLCSFMTQLNSQTAARELEKLQNHNKFPLQFLKEPSLRIIERRAAVERFCLKPYPLFDRSHFETSLIHTLKSRRTYRRHRYWPHQ